MIRVRLRQSTRRLNAKHSAATNWKRNSKSKSTQRKPPGKNRLKWKRVDVSRRRSGKLKWKLTAVQRCRNSRNRSKHRRPPRKDRLKRKRIAAQRYRSSKNKP